MVDFSNIVLGQEYDRPTLARLWGYKSFNAFSKGVFTPRDQRVLVLFVTKEKQKSLTQYEEHIDQDLLFWEGEKGHGTDARIVSRLDDIHVFYRDRHHSPFIYKGLAELKYHQIRESAPSKFVFRLIDLAVKEKDIVRDILAAGYLTETEKKAIVNARRGQGLFRTRSLELWKTCSVTGFTKKEVLIASHIKPWKPSTNPERLDPFNSLLLVPTVDKLFDKGYISFEHSGRILLSERIDKSDWSRVGLDRHTRLREVPRDLGPYLDYHQEYVFDFLK